MMQNTKEINFFARQKEMQYRDNKTLEKLTAKLTILGVVVMCIAGGVGFYSLKTMGMQKEINRIDAFLNSPEVVRKFEDVRIKKQLLDVLQQYSQAITSAGDRIQSYPDFDKKVIGDIEKRIGGSLVIQSMDYSGGNITLTCSTSDHNDIANFVYTLRRSPYIHDVNYAGYAKAGEVSSTVATDNTANMITTEDTALVSKGYDTTIEIVLKPGGEIHEAN